MPSEVFFIFELEFFGCRGSTPVSKPDVMKYGGNTTCIALYAGEQLLLVDGGTGLSAAQAALFDTGKYQQADFFITHSHWDHVQGFPFFRPLFSPAFRFDFYSEEREGKGFAEQLVQIMAPPIFPIPPAAFQSKIAYHKVVCGQTFTVKQVKVEPFRLRHPNICTGFRFAYEGKTVCVVMDYEHGETIPLELLSNTDVLIYDAQFTDVEYKSKIGWGHSSWEQGCQLATLCQAKRLYLSHHDPWRRDEDLDLLNEKARQTFPNAYFAREGLRVCV